MPDPATSTRKRDRAPISYPSATLVPPSNPHRSPASSSQAWNRTHVVQLSVRAGEGYYGGIVEVRHRDSVESCDYAFTALLLRCEHW